MENWEFIRNLTREEKTDKEIKNKTSKGWYKCKKCGLVISLQKGNFKKRMTICDCQKTKNPKEESNKRFNEEKWEFLNLLTEEECKKIDRVYGSYRGWYQCLTCGAIKHSTIGDFNRYKMLCDNGCQGSLKNLNKTIRGVDDLATTHPHLVQYFANPLESKTLKAGNNKLINMKCPYCGLEKRMKPNDLVNQGFGCQKCSDSISYPERFIGSLLTTLNIIYQKQFTLDDNKSKYDFYIPSTNLIIETHGMQHYKETFYRVGGRSLEEEIINDTYKKELALSKGYKYVVLDCRYSTLKWIKNSILKSELKNFIELHKIPWEEIAKRSESSLLIQVCEHYEKKGGSLRELSLHFHLGKTTIKRYLERGNEIGLCNWKPLPNGQLQKKPIVAIKENEVYEVAESLQDIAKKMDYDMTTIGKLSNGVGSRNKNSRFTNSKKMGGKIGFYYLNSEEWERDKHLYGDPNKVLKLFS